MIDFSVKVDQRALDRAAKSLDKWKKKPLALLMSRITRAALSLTLPATKARAARHNRTGATQRGYLVRKLKTRGSENAAWKMDSNTPWRHFVLKDDPYVDEVFRALEPTVVRFIHEQVRRLT